MLQCIAIRSRLWKLKNEAAVALARLKRGVKEKKSAIKAASSRANIQKAIAARWKNHTLKAA